MGGHALSCPSRFRHLNIARQNLQMLLYLTNVLSASGSMVLQQVQVALLLELRMLHHGGVSECVLPEVCSE